MLSATVAHEIRAPVARVWNVLVDAEGYGSWHPFLSGAPHPHRDLWSDDSLTVSLRWAEDVPAEPPTSALVVEVRRHRLVSMLLQEQTSERPATGRHQDDQTKAVGAYRVDLEAGRAGQTVLLQRISLRHPHGLEQAALDSLLKQVAAGITERTENARGDEQLGRPITGAVCVRSSSGLRRRELPSRSRFLTTIAKWMARRPGGDSV